MKLTNTMFCLAFWSLTTACIHADSTAPARLRQKRVRSASDFGTVSSRINTLQASILQLQEQVDQENEIIEETLQEEEEMAEMMEAIVVMEEYSEFSMATNLPSDLPSLLPSGSPSMIPTGPTMDSALFDEPISALPTSSPSSAAPSVVGARVEMSEEPSDAPSIVPSSAPSASPTDTPSNIPTISSAPSLSPTFSPSISPAPTVAPTMESCGVSFEDREEQILALLDAHTDPDLIRDVSTPQGQATFWLLVQDFRRICPNEGEKPILQRWVLAVIYFSTNGGNWIRCAAFGGDDCGNERLFLGKRRFLSDANECQWAGISCNVDGCVTEIEFGM